MKAFEVPQRSEKIRGYVHFYPWSRIGPDKGFNKIEKKKFVILSVIILYFVRKKTN